MTALLASLWSRTGGRFAAALAGVVYMPADFARARSTARDIAARNGFPNGGRYVVFSQYPCCPGRAIISRKGCRILVVAAAATGYAGSAMSADRHRQAQVWHEP